MIKSIRLQNFQSHQDSILEFTNGINIISGSSNNGKSSIIKAINWIISNEPKGTDIITYNEKECRVKLEIDDNIIEKIKSDKENKFIINDIELKSVGQSIPEEINNLNFNELNLQMQFDKFFLLQDSPGEVARILNRIINLSIIDESIKKIKSKVNKKKNDIDYLEEDINTIKIKLDKYNNLEEIEDIIIKCENLEKEKESIKEKIFDLDELKNNINKNNLELKKYKNIDKQKVLLKKLKLLKLNFEEINNKIFKLNNIKKDYINNIEELESYKYNKVKLELIKKLKNKISDYNNLADKIDTLESYKENKNMIKELNNKIFNIGQLKSNLLKELKICPICKRSM